MSEMICPHLNCGGALAIDNIDHQKSDCPHCGQKVYVRLSTSDTDMLPEILLVKEYLQFSEEHFAASWYSIGNSDLTSFRNYLRTPFFENFYQDDFETMIKVLPDFREILEDRAVSHRAMMNDPTLYFAATMPWSVLTTYEEKWKAFEEYVHNPDFRILDWTTILPTNDDQGIRAEFTARDSSGVHKTEMIVSRGQTKDTPQEASEIAVAMVDTLEAIIPARQHWPFGIGNTYDIEIERQRPDTLLMKATLGRDRVEYNIYVKGL